MKTKILFLFILSFLLNSCSPPYFLYIQNNTIEAVEVHVELNNNKYRKILENRKLSKYKGTDYSSVLSSDSSRNYLKNNSVLSEKYQFSSETEYHFILEPNLLSNIEPNNGMIIYPFQNIYYIQKDKKCYLVPIKNNSECNFKISKQPKLIELIEVEN